MDKPNAPHPFQSKSFSSFDELQELVLGYDLDFRPLSPSTATPSIAQYAEGSSLLSYLNIHCKLDQRGSQHAGSRTLAIPLGQNSGIKTWFGQEVKKDSLLLFPDHGEIDCVSKSGFEVFILTLPESKLFASAEQLGISATDKWSDGSEQIIHCDPIARKKLVMSLKEFQHSGSARHFVQAFNLTDQVLEKMLAMMIEPSPTLTSSNNLQCYIKPILEYINAHQQSPLKIKVLCKIIGVSERTLQRIFNHHYGISPKQFINSQRMYGLHRDLRAADPAITKVAALAHYWEYWHMGQLAKDYQYLFGELPSETLNKT